MSASPGVSPELARFIARAIIIAGVAYLSLFGALVLFVWGAAGQAELARHMLSESVLSDLARQAAYGPIISVALSGIRWLR